MSTHLSFGALDLVVTVDQPAAALGNRLRRVVGEMPVVLLGAKEGHLWQKGISSTDTAYAQLVGEVDGDQVRVTAGHLDAILTSADLQALGLGRLSSTDERAVLTPSGLLLGVRPDVLLGTLRQGSSSDSRRIAVVVRGRPDGWELAVLDTAPGRLLDPTAGALSSHMNRCALPEGIELLGLVDAEAVVVTDELVWTPLAPRSEPLVWQVGVMAVVRARTARARLEVPVRSLRVTRGPTGTLLDASAVPDPTWQKPKPGLVLTWSEGVHQSSLAPVSVVPVPPAAVFDPLADPTSDPHRQHGRLWLRTHRGWLDLAGASKDRPWPAPDLHTAQLVPLNPWFSAVDDTGAVLVDLALDRSGTARVHVELLPDTKRATVTIPDPVLVVSHRRSGHWVGLAEDPPSKGQDTPPWDPDGSKAEDVAWQSVPVRAPSASPLALELGHDATGWTLTSPADLPPPVHWSPSLGLVLAGDPAWATQDPDRSHRPSELRALLPRHAWGPQPSSRTLRLRARRVELDDPQDDAHLTRPGLLRGASGDRLGLEVEVLPTGSVTAVHRRAVSLLDERWQSVSPALLAPGATASVPGAMTWVVENGTPFPGGPSTLGKLRALPLPPLVGDEQRPGSPHGPLVRRPVDFGEHPTRLVLITNDDLTSWSLCHEDGGPPVVGVRLRPATLETNGSTAWIETTIDDTDALVGRIRLELSRSPDGTRWTLKDVSGNVQIAWTLIPQASADDHVRTLIGDELLLVRNSGDLLDLLVTRIWIACGEEPARFALPVSWSVYLRREAMGTGEGPPGPSAVLRTQVDQLGMVHGRPSPTTTGWDVRATHPLPGLMLSETLAPGDRRMAVWWTNKVLDLDPESCVELGDRVLVSWAGAERAEKAVELLARPGLTVQTLTRVYLELHRRADGSLVPVSGMIGWEGARWVGLEPARVSDDQASEPVPCQATIKWKRDNKPVLELDGVWRTRVALGQDTTAEIDLVLWDRVLPLSFDPESVAPHSLLTPFEVGPCDVAVHTLVRLRRDGTHIASRFDVRWAGPARMSVRPWVDNVKAEVGGSFLVVPRDERAAAGTFAQRRDVFALLHDHRPSGAEPAGHQVELRVDLRATHGTLELGDGRLVVPPIMPGDVDDATVVAAPIPPKGTTDATVRVVNGPPASYDKRLRMGALLTAAGTWVATTATAWRPLDRAAGAQPRRVWIPDGHGLRVLAELPASLPNPTQAAKRMLALVGWHREAVLERQDEGGRTRWDLVDSPLLNRDLQLQWLGTTSEALANVPEPPVRRETYSALGPDPRIVSPTFLPADPPATFEGVHFGAATDDRAPEVAWTVSTPEPSAGEPSPMFVAARFSAGSPPDLTSRPWGRTVIRLHRHVPFQWDQRQVATSSSPTGTRRGAETSAWWETDVTGTSMQPRPWAAQVSFEGDPASTPRTSDPGPGIVWLRMDAPRPGELLDLGLDVWTQRVGRAGPWITASERRDVRVRTPRAAPGRERIQGLTASHAAPNGAGMVPVQLSWKQVHSEQRVLGVGVVVRVHAPATTAVDPTEPVRLWVFCLSGASVTRGVEPEGEGRVALFLTLRVPSVGSPLPAAPPVTLRCRLPGATEDLPLTSEASNLHDGIGVRIDELLEADGSPASARLEVDLPPALSAVAGQTLEVAVQVVWERSPSTERVVHPPIGVALPGASTAVALAPKGASDGTSVSTTIIHAVDPEGVPRLAALGPETPGPWEAEAAQEDGTWRVLWLRPGAWTTHVHPDVPLDTWRVATLSADGSWSDANR